MIVFAPMTPTRRALTLSKSLPGSETVVSERSEVADGTSVIRHAR